MLITSGQPEITLVSNKVCICSYEAGDRSTKLDRLSIQEFPECVRQQVPRDRLDIYAVIVPNEMKLGVFCDDDVSSPNRLMVQR